MKKLTERMDALEVSVSDSLNLIEKLNTAMVALLDVNEKVSAAQNEELGSLRTDVDTLKDRVDAVEIKMFCEKWLRRQKSSHRIIRFLDWMHRSLVRFFRNRPSK